MISIASIVEGHGEVRALPVLLRRFLEWKPSPLAVNMVQPIRVHRDRFLNKDDEFRKQLLLAAAKSGDDGWILIVLDADDDCPATLGPSIMHRANKYVSHRKVSVILANREYEAWFIAAAHSLNGKRGFGLAPDEVVDSDVLHDAKGWVERHMGGIYREVLDQPAFSAQFDLQQAFCNSRSFRKLCKEWRMHIQGLD